MTKKGVISEGDLLGWLKQRIPAIQKWYEEAVETRYYAEDEEVDLNAYFVLSALLKPYIHALLEMGNDQELQRVFELIEYLANHGDPAVQNEIRVMMAEIDIWRVWRFLGNTTRRNRFEGMTWFPKWKDRDIPQNTHVDETHYQKRWNEEIEKIGGFENLTTARELQILRKLIQEFQLSGMNMPESTNEE